MLLSNYIKKRVDVVLGLRYDENPAFYYYGEKDFDGIKCEKFQFEGDKGLILRGGFFYYDKINYQRVVFFEHGLSSGYHSYFTEINMLAQHGYTVFAYDHTGCVSSDGKSVVGFAQSLNDLDHAINAVKKDERFKDATISVVGHSWGGFSTLNICALHPEITHLVAISGFISVKQIIKQYVPGIIKRYRKEVFQREEKNNPDYVNFDARESLKKSDAKLMVIHSKDDKMVDYNLNFGELFKAIEKRKNTIFISFEKKGHNPNYSYDGVNYYNNFIRDYTRMGKKKLLSSPSQKEGFKNSRNWKKITEQDKSLWNNIFEFLDSQGDMYL